MFVTDFFSSSVAVLKHGPKSTFLFEGREERVYLSLQIIDHHMEVKPGQEELKTKTWRQEPKQKAQTKTSLQAGFPLLIGYLNLSGAETPTQ